MSTEPPAIDPFEVQRVLAENRDLESLRQRFPSMEECNYVLVMNGPDPSYFDEMCKGPAKGRRAEVVLVACHADGTLWLHAKHFYPAGIYRLPTGGVHLGETAWEAAQRELREELGIAGEPTQCLGLLRYELFRRGRSLHFSSFVFRFETGTAEPHPQDSGENICSFQRVPPAQLDAVANALKNLRGQWQDWGHFRAIAHEFVHAVWNEAPLGRAHNS
ncbi:MAG: NUDIX hydrolase [Anaerolineae bacterium]